MRVVQQSPIREGRSQRSVTSRLFGFAALGGYIFAGFIAIPVVIGLFLFPDAPRLAGDALVVLGLIALAVLLHLQSHRVSRSAQST